MTWLIRTPHDHIQYLSIPANNRVLDTEPEHSREEDIGKSQSLMESARRTVCRIDAAMAFVIC